MKLLGGSAAPSAADVPGILPKQEAAGDSDPPAEPDLAAIVMCWPKLPAETKAAILAIIGAYVDSGPSRTQLPTVAATANSRLA